MPVDPRKRTLGGGPRPTAAAVTPRVETRTEARNGRLLFVARLDVPAPRRRVWELLTDYDGLARYMPNIRESRLLQRRGDRARVLQVASTPLLPLRFELELEFGEEAPARLAFVQREGNLRDFAGSWELAPLGGGTCIRYNAEGAHDFPVPDVLFNLVLGQQVESMMQALGRELS